MSNSSKTNINLVKKNDAWVPQKKNNLTILESYGIIKGPKLGEGAYAKVFLAESRKHNNKKLAIKVIDKFKAPKDFLEKFLDREISIMKHLQHPNVIKLYHTMETDTKVYLLLELAEKGDLLEYINGREVVQEDEAKQLFCQLAAAMAYCHSINVIHRDIKCENLLVDAYGNLKVTDFGFAAYTDKSRLMETFCGSYAYCCPEILRGEPYSGMLGDVWSMGVVLYALVCSRLPFSDDDLRVLVRGEQTKPKLKFVKTVGKACRDLVKRMLAIDKNKRYTAKKVLQHPWLKAEFEKLNVAHKALASPKGGTRLSSPPSAPVSSDYQEECYPLVVKPIHSKIGNTDPELVKCLTAVSTNKSAGFELGKKRRSTIAAEHDLSLIPSRKVSLRDELLRNLADKEMKSRSAESLVAKVAKKPSVEVEVEIEHPSNYRRRSTLVTDIKKADTALVSAKAAATKRKSSLVSDVVKVRTESKTEQKSKKTPERMPHTEHKARRTSLKGQTTGNIVDRVSSMARSQLKCEQKERGKELEHLKFSMAGKAARALADERSAAERKDAMAEEAIVQMKQQKVVIIEKMEKWRGKCQKMMGVKQPLLIDKHSPALNTKASLAQPSISHYY